MKRSIINLTFASILTTTAAASYASDNSWKKEASDAWIDGSAEATLLFNGDLNSFDINTDVRNGVVTLTGQVENDVERKLAEELVLGVDGVAEVNNKLTVMEEHKTSENSDAESTLIDAKIATVIKSRLLFDSDISGTDIDVDVNDQVVTLTGDVKSDAEKSLVMSIAKNATDVKDVNDELNVVDRS